MTNLIITPNRLRPRATAPPIILIISPPVIIAKYGDRAANAVTTIVSLISKGY
jgi:hypothetical protein